MTAQIPASLVRQAAPILLIFALFCPSTQADEAPQTIRVIAYNIQFLPSFASVANKRKQPDYRAERIGKELASFDIVALNEIFDERRREIVLDQLRRTWGDDLNVMVSPKPKKQFDGGCLIASRFPFVETNSFIYTHFSKPEDYGIYADGHAAKGVIHARIALPASGNTPRHVDVFVTHLEARADDMRVLQYPELAAFVKQHSTQDSPCLILGDMNTNGTPERQRDPKSDYADLLNQLKNAYPNHVEDVWPLLMGDAYGGTSEQESIEEGKRIDYIFLGNPQDPANQLIAQSIKVNPYLDDKVVALSDHNAVEASFNIAP